MVICDDIELVKNPKISIVVCTYNQEQYISSCLDSIINQKTNFDFEIIIGEDCGVDDTRKICMDYQRHYPDKIKLLLHEQNLGMMGNYSKCIKEIRGEYMANVGGDDYWCDPLKLQKQVDILTDNQDYGVVFTAGILLYDNGVIKDHPKSYVSCENGDVRHLSQYGPLGLASSMVARSELFQLVNFDEILENGLPAEDYVINAIWGLHTKFWFLEDKTIVRRVLKTSLSHRFGDKKYRQGIIKTRLYLGNKFPNDYVFDIDGLNDEWNYLEFRDAIYNCKYKDAVKYKGLISPSYQNKKQFCKLFKNRFSFIFLVIYIRLQKLFYSPDQ